MSRSKAGNLREQFSYFRSCRFCSCQSTNDPHTSTGLEVDSLNDSIHITYFHSISTGFNKSFDLFWEQRC